jgi:crotonobetaine/carnitine-CoA ligase
MEHGQAPEVTSPAGQETPAAATPSALAAAIPPRDRTLPVLLERQARRHGDRVLFVAGNVAWTYAQARTVAARFAGTLSAAGIKPGDRVAVMCSNRAEFMQVYLGCAWLGDDRSPDQHGLARRTAPAHYK